MKTHGYGREALIEVGRHHWREYLPEKYASLQASGDLEKELRAAVDLTLREMESWKKAGFSLHEAWEAVREHYLILREEPDEDEEPMPPNPVYDASWR
jgi:hypothetical protein